MLGTVGNAFLLGIVYSVLYLYYHCWPFVIVISPARGLSGIYCTKHEGAQRPSAVGNKSQTNQQTVI